MRTDLDRFFNPRAIAIVGASQDLNTISGQPLKFLKSHGYTGALYPVNPRHAEVAGVKCHARLADLPETPDLALILVNAARVPEVLRQCGEKGVPYVIIFSSGFAETGGTGAALQSELIAIAREGLVRIGDGSGDAPDERGFLDPLAAVAERGRSPGEDVLERWEGEWERSPTRLIEYARY